YKASYARRRISARMRARAASDASAYVRLLLADPDEIGRLLGALSTKVTDFFRNPGLYGFLARSVVPEILAAAPPGRTVRLWSAGCSAGEEAWSLAAVVETTEPRERAPSVRVIGTDVDGEAVAAARRGWYPIAALRQVPASIQRSCFSVRPGAGTCAPVSSL